MTAGGPRKAIALADYAREHGHDAEVAVRSKPPACIDVVIEGTHEGWLYTFAVRWYRDGDRWALGYLHGKPVAGIASYAGDEGFTFLLSSVRALREALANPAELVEWLFKANDERR